MDREDLRDHIESATGEDSLPGGFTASVLMACWPGGMQDRSERAALQWVRRWHPARAAMPVPACSCVTGRCAVCN
jgi:hypothetical protein